MYTCVLVYVVFLLGFFWSLSLFKHVWADFGAVLRFTCCCLSALRLRFAKTWPYLETQVAQNNAIPIFPCRSKTTCLSGDIGRFRAWPEVHTSLQVQRSSRPSRRRHGWTSCHEFGQFQVAPRYPVRGGHIDRDRAGVHA